MLRTAHVSGAAESRGNSYSCPIRYPYQLEHGRSRTQRPQERKLLSPLSRRSFSTGPQGRRSIPRPLLFRSHPAMLFSLSFSRLQSSSCSFDSWPWLLHLPSSTTQMPSPLASPSSQAIRALLTLLQLSTLKKSPSSPRRTWFLVLDLMALSTLRGLLAEALLLLPSLALSQVSVLPVLQLEIWSTSLLLGR